MQLHRPRFHPAPLLASAVLLICVPLVVGGCGSGSSAPNFETQFTHSVMVADTNNNRIVQTNWNTETGAIETDGWKTLGGLAPGAGFGQFNHPTVIRQDNFGNFWIADTGNNRIVFMNDIEGHGWRTFGTFGSGQGQFNQPHGIDFDIGVAYIADSGNNRIVRITDISGAGWTSFGTAGNGIGQFNYPYDVNTFNRYREDVSDGIAVSDRDNNRVVFFDSDQFSAKGWQVFTGPAGGPTLSFNHPTGLAVQKYFNVVDTGNNRVVFSEITTGRATNSYSGNLNGPLSYEDNWVADTNNNRLINVDIPLSGAARVTNPFGILGSGVGQFDHPSSAIAFADIVPNGTVHVH